MVDVATNQSGQILSSTIAAETDPNHQSFFEFLGELLGAIAAQLQENMMDKASEMRNNVSGGEGDDGGGGEITPADGNDGDVVGDPGDGEGANDGEDGEGTNGDFAAAQSEFQAAQQEFSMFMEVISTILKSLGQSAQSLARQN